MSACAELVAADRKMSSPCTTYGEMESRRHAVGHCNKIFSDLDVQDRIAWSLENLPGQHVVTSSFGAQAAVSLHLLTRHMPEIPVVLIDTGYLFPETYRFVDHLTERLQLNLHVYQATVSPAWQEARDGQRWTQGETGLALYNSQVKVEPMKRAIRELKAGTWFAGLRRTQSQGRESTPFLEWSNDRWKVHPIADWTDRDVHMYLKKHDLPYHPLREQGYLSIGDHHTTRSIHEVSDTEQLRFFGIKRECGLHEIDMASV